MECKFLIPELQYALKMVKDISTQTAANPNPPGVRIVAQKNKVTFSTFNSEMLVQASVQAEVKDEGEITCDPVPIYNTIAYFKPENSDGVGTLPIRLKATPSSNKVSLSSKTKYLSGHEVSHRCAFPLKSESFFPEFPTDSSVIASFKMLAEPFTEGIGCVAFALAKDAHLRLFTGVLFHVDAGVLTLFATNGVCLAEYSIPIDYSGPSFRVILPGPFTQKVAKSFYVGDTLTFRFTDSILYISSSNLVIGGVLVKEEYPDYKNLLPVPSKFATIDRDILLDNLSNLSFQATSDEDNRVSVKLQPKNITLSSGQSVNDGIPGEADCQFEFDCKLSFIIGAIRNGFGPEVKFGFIDVDKPVKIFSDTKSVYSANLTCFLVPLSL